MDAIDSDPRLTQQGTNFDPRLTFGLDPGMANLHTIAQSPRDCSMMNSM